MMKEKVDNKFGVASLVNGIVGLGFFLMPYIGLPISILSIVFASKQNKIFKSGQSSAGNVLGIIGVVINSIMLFWVIVGLLFLGAIGSFL